MSDHSGGMHPTDQYAYLVDARAKLLDWVRPLALDQYAQEFSIGRKSIRATLVHTAGAEWAYVLRLRGEPVPPPEHLPFTPFNTSEFAPFERRWAEQADRTRSTLAGLTEWGRQVEFMLAGATPPVRVRTTVGGIVTQLLFHEVHHRAQVMAMLRQLGVPAQNIDYSLIGWERSEVRG